MPIVIDENRRKEESCEFYLHSQGIFYSHQQKQLIETFRAWHLSLSTSVHRKKLSQSPCSISVQQTESQVSQCSNEIKVMNRSQKQNSVTIDIPEDKNYRLFTFLVNRLKKFLWVRLLSIGPSCSNVYVNFTLMHFLRKPEWNFKKICIYLQI